MEQVEKKCVRCHRLLRLDRFYEQRVSPPSMQEERLNECKPCANSLRWANGRIRDEEHRSVVYEQNRMSYVKHRDRTLLRESDKRRAFKQDLIDQYGGCQDCGEDDVRCLEFHHRDPSTKRFHVSAMMRKTQEQIQDEISKCDILCANCI